MPLPPRPHTYAVPVRFGPRGYLGESRGTDAALTCVDVVLSTRVGEVEMEPEFGSRLSELAFEPNDAALAQEMRAETAGAIARWEPRFSVDAVAVTQDQHQTDVALTLRPRAGASTGQRQSRAVSFSRR
jgi:hypothetical protein